MINLVKPQVELGSQFREEKTGVSKKSLGTPIRLFVVKVDLLFGDESAATTKTLKDWPEETDANGNVTQLRSPKYTLGNEDYVFIKVTTRPGQ